MSRRAAFIFDGPNFYKNIMRSGINRGHYSIYKLAQLLAGPRTIISVTYFTSPVDKAEEPASYASQQKFFAALTSSGVNVSLGNLVKRKEKCVLCGGEITYRTEKSTDVKIALAIALGAADDLWDDLYIASCDSDLIPAIQYARQKDKKVFLMMPAGAKCYGVGEACDTTIRITQEHIDKAQI